MRSFALLIVLLALGAPRTAHAHGAEFTGNYVALGPTVGTARFGERRAFHVGGELSAGHVGEHLGYGGWIDFAKAFGSLQQERLGAGLQITSGSVALLGFDAGALAIHDRGDWHAGFRARVFLTTGWVGIAGGGGVVANLGSFTEFSLLLKVPFSCDIGGALDILCSRFWDHRIVGVIAAQENGVYALLSSNPPASRGSTIGKAQRLC